MKVSELSKAARFYIEKSLFLSVWRKPVIISSPLSVRECPIPSERQREAEGDDCSHQHLQERVASHTQITIINTRIAEMTRSWMLITVFQGGGQSNATNYNVIQS